MIVVGSAADFCSVKYECSGSYSTFLWTGRCCAICCKDYINNSAHLLNGDWTRIRGVDFGVAQAKELTLEVLNVKNEGTIEFYADAMSDKPFARVEVKKDSVELSIPVSNSPTGIHDVSLHPIPWWRQRTLRLRLVATPLSQFFLLKNCKNYVGLYII